MRIILILILSFFALSLSAQQVGNIPPPVSKVQEVEINDTLIVKVDSFQLMLSKFDSLVSINIDLKSCLDSISIQNDYRDSLLLAILEKQDTSSNQAAKLAKRWLAKFEMIDGERDTLQDCRQVSFALSSQAAGTIDFEFADGSTETLPVDLLVSPAWNASDDFSVLSNIIYDASNASGVLLNTIGCRSDEQLPFECDPSLQDCTGDATEPPPIAKCDDPKSFITQNSLCWITQSNQNFHVQ